MLTILVNLLIKDKEDTQNPQVRQKYGMLCGMAGIILNIFLFLGKFLAGAISHSVSITADAFNNLSDAGSSCVTLIGFKLAGARPDVGHPFGHGRIEYIAGLTVSGAILLMAFELAKTSLAKAAHPQPVAFRPLAAAILIASILVKLYMAFYNHKIGQKISSAAMRAAALDSLGDACATAVVLAASLAGELWDIQIDGYCGVLVALFIFYAGFSAAKETLDLLLGKPPEQEFVRRIEEIVLSHKAICGVHDLLVHDYGPGRRSISLHAEVPAEGDILELHDIIDQAEMELCQKLGCEAVIHMDPIVTNDAYVLRLRDEVARILEGMDPAISMHDFRVVPRPSRTNLIFDIVVPYGYRTCDEALALQVQKQVREILGDSYFVTVQVDKKH